MSREYAREGMVGAFGDVGFTLDVGGYGVADRIMGILEDADMPVPAVLREVLHQVVLEIRELENNVQENTRYQRERGSNAQAMYSNARFADSNDSVDEISFKKIKIRSSFLLKYEILSK